MRRYSLTARRLILVVAAALLASLAVATAAQAVVVNDGGTAVRRRARAGACEHCAAAAFRVAPSGSVQRPLLSPDLPWLTTGLVSPLCYHGGSVIHEQRDVRA